ncbi:MAG: 50S ribosomal protein L18 [Victivallales bacterium]|nr:50S ribosomal protein L18 [Victivallales bacterium]MCF7889201.1 50S ribosomal protein L18 [Victivallales bacterium]
MTKLTKKQARERRHKRLRNNITGSLECPRMSVFVSNKHMYIQYINDETGTTLVSSSTLSPEFKESGAKFDVKGAETLGTIAAEKAKKVGISSVVFDRGGFTYHGKVKAIADAARKSGIKF